MLLSVVIYLIIILIATYHYLMTSYLELKESNEPTNIEDLFIFIFLFFISNDHIISRYVFYILLILNWFRSDWLYWHEMYFILKFCKSNNYVERKFCTYFRKHFYCWVSSSCISSLSFFVSLYLYRYAKYENNTMSNNMNIPNIKNSDA